MDIDNGISIDPNFSVCDTKENQGKTSDLFCLSALSSTFPLSSSSLVQLAHKYRQGVASFKQDKKESGRLYKLAAQQGDADGEAWLAYFFFNGMGRIEK